MIREWQDSSQASENFLDFLIDLGTLSAIGRAVFGLAHIVRSLSIVFALLLCMHETLQGTVGWHILLKDILRWVWSACCA